MGKVNYELSKEYIEGVLEKSLTDEEWGVVAEEVLEEIEAVMYDTVLALKYKWDDLFPS